MSIQKCVVPVWARAGKEGRKMRERRGSGSRGLQKQGGNPAKDQWSSRICDDRREAWLACRGEQVFFSLQSQLWKRKIGSRSSTETQKTDETDEAEAQDGDGDGDEEEDEDEDEDEDEELALSLLFAFLFSFFISSSFFFF